MHKAIPLAVALAAPLVLLSAPARSQPAPSTTTQPTAPTQPTTGSTTSKTTTTSTQGSSSTKSKKTNTPPDWAPAYGYRQNTGSPGGTGESPGQSKSKKNK